MKKYESIAKRNENKFIIYLGEIHNSFGTPCELDLSTEEYANMPLSELCDIIEHEYELMDMIQSYDPTHNPVYFLNIKLPEKLKGMMPKIIQYIDLKLDIEREFELDKQPKEDPPF